jgi:phosphoserine aminotransferase
MDMTQRIYNFSPGPAVMPLPVLERIQREMVALPGVGASILEISHRSKAFDKILDSAKSGLRSLLKVPENYKILFLQGGSRLQFSMVPMNLLRGAAKPAEYLIHGSWGKYAVEEARREGEVRVVWDGKATNYDRLPAAGELKLDPGAAYLHFTSNETIQGVQFPGEPTTSAPLVCDASSDFLCRPLDVAKYGLIYACAQKNAGPAGVTVVIIRDDLLARSQETLPGYLSYKRHADEDSRWNTPNTFGIYAFDLICQWLAGEIGGLGEMLEVNRKKAKILYDVVDEFPDFYIGHAQPTVRSLMNVTFRLPSEELTTKFVEGAKSKSLTELKGHRSVGGIRASIYNAMPLPGVEQLAEFMREFRKAN